jgi:hypothetical protein
MPMPNASTLIRAMAWFHDKMQQEIDVLSQWMMQECNILALQVTQDEDCSAGNVTSNSTSFLKKP